MSLKKFYVVGVSYKKAPLSTREDFSLSIASSKALLIHAKKIGVPNLLVNSTCNRTELFGFSDDPKSFIKLLCLFSKGKTDVFKKLGYIIEGSKAIKHIFRVGSGLESQILGDFEIIGQLKKSFNLSKKLEMVNGFTERMLNSVIQASKKVKTQTGLSSGATSVSFAAVQYILQNIKDISKKNILLFGAGKIGKNTCENLIKHTKNDHIVLINRTKERAERIAGKFKVIVKKFSELNTEIRKSDILIVATGADNPTINKELIHSSKPLLVIDLSLPRNVDPLVSQINDVSLVHVDELSKMTDKNLSERKKHIDKAEKIINESYKEFDIWLNNRKYAPFLNAIKNHLENPMVRNNESASKLTGQVASYLKNNPKNATAAMDLLVDLFELEFDKHVKV
ncbi:MAG: glutamyl-tRNA reductase [Flavobacteriaceae bacterium]|nr:glutamyl-tRNA reductase [Flavobacteriaceae bacterium]